MRCRSKQEDNLISEKFGAHSEDMALGNAFAIPTTFVQ